MHNNRFTFLKTMIGNNNLVHSVQYYQAVQFRYSTMSLQFFVFTQHCLSIQNEERSVLTLGRQFEKCVIPQCL